MQLYFVVRTDVTAQSGAQRVFYCEETLKKAQEQLAHLKTIRIGTFAVYAGNPVK